MSRIGPEEGRLVRTTIWTIDQDLIALSLDALTTRARRIKWQ